MLKHGFPFFFSYSPGGGEPWCVNNWDRTVRKRRRKEKRERNPEKRGERRRRSNSNLTIKTTLYSKL